MPRYWGYSKVGQMRLEEMTRVTSHGVFRPLGTLGTLEYPAAAVWCDVHLSEVIGKE